MPGPVWVPTDVLAASGVDYGSGDLEDEFFGLYERVQEQLQHILMTRSQVAAMTGIHDPHAQAPLHTWH